MWRESDCYLPDASSRQSAGARARDVEQRTFQASRRELTEIRIANRKMLELYSGLETMKGDLSTRGISFEWGRSNDHSVSRFRSDDDKHVIVLSDNRREYPTRGDVSYADEQFILTECRPTDAYQDGTYKYRFSHTQLGATSREACQALAEFIVERGSASQGAYFFGRGTALTDAEVVVPRSTENRGSWGAVIGSVAILIGILAVIGLVQDLLH
jgi:hypothetical protein